MNAFARLGVLVLIVGLAMTSALLVKAESLSQATGTVTVPGSGEFRVAETLPARHVDVRISDPLVFNVTLAILTDEQAEDYLSGKDVEPSWVETFHGPGTLAFDPPQRGAYLFVFRNADPQAVSLSMSHHQEAGADRELLRIGGAVALSGLALAVAGVLVGAIRRWRRAPRST